MAEVDYTATSRVGMHVSDGCLIVPVQAELYDEALRELRADLLAKVAETRVIGVVLELSAAEIIDRFAGETFCEMARMTRLLGAEMVVSGIRPAVAAALVECDVAMDIRSAVTLEHALKMLRSAHWREEQEPEPLHDEEDLSGEEPATASPGNGMSHEAC